MANTKIYKIEINGLQESINAVETLNKQLDNLEQRMNRLNQTRVSTGGGGGASRGGNTSALSDEERVQKEINKLKEEGQKLDAKIAASQDEIYKRVDATKQLYKETIADQKAIAAQERLVADSYSNTMQGMKNKLADLKSAINTTDLGDGDQIKKMTQEANELTNKLKEMEESYGQFGRNVGNYASAAEGFKGIQVNVGGVIREFDNAKEASRTLNNELKTMAVNGQTDTDEFKNLRQAVMQMESAMNDAKKPMDDLMDAMESITALASVSQGFSALFGIDDSEIQRSIQKLVALQNVLKGIETINKQMQTGEGIGSWLSKGSDAIDKMVQSIFGVEKASKAATVASKALGTALKALGIGLVIAAVTELINLYETWSDNQRKAAEEAEEAAEKIKKAADEQRQAYVSASASYMNAASRLSYLRTEYKNTNDELRKTNIIKEASEEFKKLGINVKGVNDAQRIFVEDGDKVIQLLKLQGDAAAVAALRMEAFKKSFQMLLENGYDANAASILAGSNKDVLELDKRLGAIQDQMGKLKSKLKIGVNDVGKGVSKSIDKTNKDITDLELRLMRDGLNKKLRQLDEEERQTINKLRENGRKSAAEIEKVHRQFDLLRKKEIDEYLKNVEQSIATTAENIKKVGFEINTSKLHNQLSELQNEFERLSQDRPIRNMYISQSETSNIKRDYKVDDSKIEFARSYQNLFSISEATNQADEYYSFLNNYIKDKDRELFADISDYHKAIYETTDEEQKQVYMKGLEDTYKKVSNLIEEEYANELLYIRNYTQRIDQTLTESFEYRIKSEKKYDEHYRQTLMQNLAAQAVLNKKMVQESVESAKEAESTRYSTQISGLTLQKEAVKEAMSAIEKTYKVSGLEGVEAIKDSNKEIYKQYHDLFAKTVEIDALIQTAKAQHKQKLVEITKEGEEKIKKIEIDSAKEISDEQEKTFNNQITNIRDAQSKINEILSQQPLTNSLGIVNVSATKKQYKEIEVAAQKMVSEIIAQQQLLNVAFSKGLIKPEAMNAIKTQLNDLLAAFKQTLTDIKNSSKDTIPKFIQSLNVYLQAGVQSFQDIMSAVWDAQDTQFDKEQEQLDKMNELLDKKLDEQEDIIQEHKNNVDSIEDELANSRGDRRQHLIDQLNAEMAAERAAEKEKQRIEKEREANEKKQDALEKKRKKAQYKRDLIQAVVNGAMAVTYAAMNTYPIPAIPLMALAAATTAAQLAIMTANKPYAKGGLLEGKSHAQGGIPIPGTGIEVEGKEYVIRKRSTAQNIDLLDYINRSERKLDLGDFIDFYSSKVRKNVSQMSPGRKYADGGALPTIANTYEFDDRLLNAMEDYSNRPVVVSVVDINDRQAAVKNVQVLAGLN